MSKKKGNRPVVVSFQLKPELTTQTIDNITYLVAPAVVIIESVLNGELVPGEEIAAFVDAWNGIPIVINHPQDDNGDHISANADPHLPRYGVMFNASWDNDGRKLAAELWINEAKLEASPHNAILDKIRDGEIVELSVGFFRDREPRSGIFNNVRYDGINRNIRPDHIALLPSDRGACSTAMGCGVPRVNQAQDFSSHAMIALYPSAGQAAEMALTFEQVPTADHILTADDLHVTVAYLGEIDSIPTTEAEILTALTAFAKHFPLIYGEVQGGGHFDPRTEGGSIPYFALLTSEQLMSFRRELIDWFLWDQSIANKSTYQPHLTLCYFHPSESIETPIITRRSLVFDAISLKWGDRVTHFSLQGQTGDQPVSLIEILQNQKDGETDMSEITKEQFEQLLAGVGTLSERLEAVDQSLETLGTAVSNQGERLEAVEGLAANIQDQAKREIDALISTLSQNEGCPLNQAALERLEIADLQTLASTYSQGQAATDFMARVGSPASNSDEWEDYTV